MQKIKRIQLNINQNNESVILGIVSAEPDYKLSLALNKKFRISLKSISPVTLHDNNSELTFSRFSDITGSPDLIYDLISNRTGKKFFLKKLKNIDYIFQIFDPGNDADINDIISALRELDCITAVFNIDSKAIKDKHLQYLIH
ncbi:MAG: IPExxxVDY family protein [Bacteroidales bacterium]|nr:IPExxxVDY family protein [Bacteroidales bacterium]